MSKTPKPSQRSRTIGQLLLRHLKELKDPYKFFRENPEWVEEASKSLARLGVFEGLSPSQQSELAALVATLYWAGDRTDFEREWHSDQKSWAKHGSGKIRQLATKVRRARAALQDIRDYLGQMQLPRTRLLNEVFGEAERFLDPTGLSKAATVNRSLRDALPRIDTRLTLYRFFVEKCNLLKVDAEIRTGRIGKRLWNWNVAVIERDDPPREPGCEAVRKHVNRVSRRRSSPDTSKRSS